MSTIAVIGDGKLAAKTAAILSADHDVRRLDGYDAEVPQGTQLALVLQDIWRPSLLTEAESRMRASGIPWLGGFIRGGDAIVGPLVRPDTPGCSSCAESRRQLAERDREELVELQVTLLLHGEVQPDPGITASGYRHAAGLAAAEASRGLSPNAETGVIHRLTFNTLEVTRHSFLPDPHCRVCGHMPDDSAEAARILLQPRPKSEAGSYRSRPLDGLREFASHYFDERTGIFNAKRIETDSLFAVAAVNLPTLYGSEISTGRSFSYAESKRTAMLEGLERYCGLQPRGRRTFVRGTYRRLAQDAIDPYSVGVYSEDQYAMPDFPFRPFDPERTIDWVWGYSFLQERPVLVPEQLAYYSLGLGDGYVHEGSNGCALGGCLEEAIFHGILEVAERDSFLMAWYGMLPLPRLDLCSSGDAELSLMAAKLRQSGYELLLFDATTENGIPGLWAVARSMNGQEPNLVCSAGAHVDPVRAAKSAVHELAGHIPWLAWRMRTEREEAIRLYRDSSQLTRMEDHSMIYALAEAGERFDFLLQAGSPLRSFDDQYRGYKPHDDLTADLMMVLETFRGLGLDVIVIDQTAPETLLHGLHCVKVLIPGMLPMTFGHHLVRLEGLDRVLRVPAELGYTNHILERSALNPYPHPFL